MTRPDEAPLPGAFSGSKMKGEQISMDSITIHFHGDFHITVSPESASRLVKSMDGQPCRAKDTGNTVSSEGYQALVRAVEDFLNDTSDEYEQYGNGAKDEDIDSIVAVMRPGKAPEVMTESECYDAVERYGEFCSVHTISVPDLCAYDLKAAYDPRNVLKLGSERYIIGPVIVYASDGDGDSISLDAEEVMAAIVYFADHTVTLCADGTDFPAFIL